MIVKNPSCLRPSTAALALLLVASCQTTTNSSATDAQPSCASNDDCAGAKVCDPVAHECVADASRRKKHEQSDAAAATPDVADELPPLVITDSPHGDAGGSSPDAGPPAARSADAGAMPGDTPMDAPGGGKPGHHSPDSGSSGAGPDRDAGNRPPRGPAAGNGNSEQPDASSTGSERSDGGSTAPPDSSTGVDGGPDGEGSSDAGEPQGPRPCTGVFSTPVRFTGFSVQGSFVAPALSPDGLTLYFSVSVNGGEQIYRATRGDRAANEFAPAEAVDELNERTLQGTPFLSGDELSLYFYLYATGSRRDLYVATRPELGAPFGDSQPVPGLNTDAREDQPWVSPDELVIYFTSDRDGGSGGHDLWVSERSSPGESFDTPAPLVGVNGADDDDSPALSADGLTLFFTSDRTGQSQVWVASRATLEDEFQNPEPLAEVASDGNDVDVTLSADDRELVISSDRGGSQRLWVARRQCP